MIYNLRRLLTIFFGIFFFLISTSVQALTPFQQLGEELFFDSNLSEPNGQSCSSCHLPSAAFADPDQDIPVSEGVISGLFGSRNSPTASYAMFSPVFHFDSTAGLWIGGQFLDGRATGNITGDPLADQALNPFLNPVEMANSSKSEVVRDVLNSKYEELFIDECGEPNMSSDSDIDEAFQCIAEAIGDFERTWQFAKFNSKYDAYLRNCVNRGNASDQELDKCAKGIGKKAKKAQKGVLTKKEWKGLKLFMGSNNNDGVLQEGEGAGCAACHTVDWTDSWSYSKIVVTPSWAPERRVPPLFTDFSYDNLGIPKSNHPLLKDNPIDLGLGPQVSDAQENGKFKVSTVRNILGTAPYGHNGFFTTLEGITSFYNTRDTGNWSVAEVPDTMNNDELGNLGLSHDQEKQLVDFMKTLSDGYF
ncbi:MAG: cytochrome c peroxidase [Methylococcaceae bacterium]